jgi:hypothetical protein
MTSITPISATDFSTFCGGNYQAMRGVASSANGTIIYVCMNGVTGVGVVRSTNSGSTWSTVYTTTGSYTSICCSSDGSIVYIVNLGNGLLKSTNTGVTWNPVTFLPNLTLPGGSANPESPAGGIFPGYDLNNMYQIACDSTGSKLIMTTNAAASIYGCTDGGATWSFLYVAPGYNSAPNAPTLVTSNSDGTILYASLNTNTISKNIIVSKNSGATWASINMLGLTGPFGAISTNSYGDFVFTVDNTSNLTIFYPTHTDKAILVPSAGNTFASMTNYNSGNNIIIAQNNYEAITNGAVVRYSLVNKYAPGQPSVPCFKEDTNILCFQDGKEVHIKVQDIRKGTLIKTLKHGYVPVNMIGTTKLYNSGDALRGTDKLYVCSSANYPSVTEDLVITGCHSILEGTITEKQKEGTLEMLGRLMVTDGKYRIMAFLDERAVPYPEEGVFPIWHLALDNDNYYMNYGIWANGLLVETCSKRYLKELSGMRLID